MSPLLPIERTSDTPIRPKDIDGDSAFIGAFRQKEQEQAAIWIVRFCQARHSWKPFKVCDLASYSMLNGGVEVSDIEKVLAFLSLFEGIIEQLSDCGVLIVEETVTLTTAFVARCYLHAPVLGLPVKKRVRKPKIDTRVSRYDLLKTCS